MVFILARTLHGLENTLQYREDGYKILHACTVFCNHYSLMPLTLQLNTSFTHSVELHLDLTNCVGNSYRIIVGLDVSLYGPLPC